MCEVVRQVAHQPFESNGRLVWDLDRLLELCRDAIAYAAAHFEQATVAIDSWGVDHGFLDVEGRLLGPPICYRDPSHAAALRSIEDRQHELYALTGIQKQPFNTLCQLIARRTEDPSLPSRATWLILPDLLAFLLTGRRGYELTQASTTQLMGLDKEWSTEAFEIAGWPLPDESPSPPGQEIAEVASGVRLFRVGSHDTASSVRGFASLSTDEVFLNIGTWSIVGCVLPEPLVSEEAHRENWSNEIAIDGQVRFLKNVPGFFVLNRLHAELGLREPMGDWLSRSDDRRRLRFDLFDESLYNPESMLAACAALMGSPPETDSEWAAAGLGSLVDTLASQVGSLGPMTGRKFTRMRVGGGGSRSFALCQALADRLRMPVVAGPVEATVLGNIAVQLAGPERTEEFEALLQSASDQRTFDPRPACASN